MAASNTKKSTERSPERKRTPEEIARINRSNNDFSVYDPKTGETKHHRSDGTTTVKKVKGKGK